MLSRARIQDALAIWDGSTGPWGEDGQPVLLKLKASLCIALGWESHDLYSHYADLVPVWFSNQNARWTWDGPECVWQEVAVPISWRRWVFVRYQNGY